MPRSLRLLVLVLLAVVVPVAPALADTTVHARLLPINHSGAHGTATLTAHDDGSLTVVVHARGLVPGQRHAQHLHGSLGSSHFMCPTMAADRDGDGILTNEEASGEYGSIFLSLTTSGDSTARSGLVTGRMPVADAHGRIDYRRTFSADELPHGLLAHLSQLHVVQHGIDVNHNGRYDMAGAGVSTFAKNLGFPSVPEEATDPADCGMVTGAGDPMPPAGGLETGTGPVGSARPPTIAGGALIAVAVALATVAVWPRRRPRTERR